MRLALALAAVMLAAPAHAITKGQAYLEARAELVADGWAPTTVAERDNEACETRKGLCELMPEIEHCYPTGTAACIMHFTRGGQRMTIETENEYIEDMVVTGWE